MIQVKPFNAAQGGTTPNMCLANTTKGYGIPNRYASAWEAWQNTQQHSGDVPTGLDVPAFFSYTATIDGETKNWGHIGVRLANGQFWSDGKVYPSVSAYTANHSPKYVGWGESVNNVQVIKQGEDMVKPSAADVYSAFNQFAMHPPSNEAQVQYYMDRDIRDLYHDLMFYEILPKKDDVKRAFTAYSLVPPTEEQLTYYSVHPGEVLFNDLAEGLNKRLLTTPEDFKEYAGEQLYVKKK